PSDCRPVIHLKPGRTVQITLKGGHMFRTVKAMTLAGTIAAGLPLLTETASAQTASGWYLIRPIACDFGEQQHADGTWTGQVVLAVSGPESNVSVIFNSELIGGMLKLCSDGTPFYSWWTGRSWSGTYRIIQGLQ